MHEGSYKIKNINYIHFTTYDYLHSDTPVHNACVESQFMDLPNNSD